MSRYTIKNSEQLRNLNYGFDHLLGYFYDITDLTKDPDSKKYFIEERSSSIDNLNRGEFAKILHEWGANKTHIEAVALDQTF